MHSTAGRERRQEPRPDTAGPFRAGQAARPGRPGTPDAGSGTPLTRRVGEGPSPCVRTRTEHVRQTLPGSGLLRGNGDGHTASLNGPGSLTAAAGFLTGAALPPGAE